MQCYTPPVCQPRLLDLDPKSLLGTDQIYFSGSRSKTPIILPRI